MVHIADDCGSRGHTEAACTSGSRCGVWHGRGKEGTIVSHYGKRNCANVEDHQVRLLREDILDQFQLGGPRTTGIKEAPANSHLSLLAMVDCWAALGKPSRLSCS